MTSCDIRMVREHQGHSISVQGRHSLERSGRGSIQLDRAIPVHERLRIQVQAFHGYGESLIDYNHSQTTLGIGIPLLQWM